jgi:hypothetical protein
MAVMTVGLSSSVWSACSSASAIGDSKTLHRRAVAWVQLKRVSAENLDMTISIEQS